MNIAVIFAGGAGVRMHITSRPKQFLELAGKPIIIYTSELFETHPEIDAIVVACLEPWIPFLKKMLRKFEINKVVRVVPGGVSGQASIYNGLCAAEEYAKEMGDENPLVLIHDGVRPLINEQTITDCVNTAREKGNCITCVPATETVIVQKYDDRIEVPARVDCKIVRAPQCFMLRDIIEAHRESQKRGLPDFIDSCSMMNYYGQTLHTIIGPMENMKITTPTDFFLFRAMLQLRENQQVFGI